MLSKPLSRATKLSVLGFSALVLAFFALAVIPDWRETNRLQNEIRAYHNAIASNAAQSVRLKEITRRGQLLRLDVKNYDRLVPDNQDLGTFLEQLTNELYAAGMHDTVVQALKPTPLGKCQQLPIEIRGIGSYAQFRDFLVHLENLPRMSSVSRLTVDTDNAVSDNLTISVTLAIYNTNTKPR